MEMNVNVQSPAPQPQIIICGLDRIGHRIFTVLEQQGIPIMGISEAPLQASPSSNADAQKTVLQQAYSSQTHGAQIHGAQIHGTQAHQPIIIGDLRDENTLIRAGIREAQTLLLTYDDDALNLAILTQARLLNPSIRIINRLFNAELGERLDQTLPNHISMSVSALVSPIFAFAAMQKPAIGQLNLFGKVWPITAVEITREHPWHQRSLAELWENPARMLLTYEPSGGPCPTEAWDVVGALQAERRLRVGDRLIIAEQPQRRLIKRSLRHRLRTYWRGFRQITHFSRAMMLVLLALLTTIAVAVATYVSNSHGTSLVDALYFSVGMITGAGGQEAVAENATNLIKVFTAVMMLVGAGVIGICYALLNDFILGTHLQQVWTNTRVPQSGHRIVCGLGGVGYRTLDQLMDLGEEVVALESDRHNRFLKAARTQNIPVIVGDATVAEILRMVNVEKAAALLAVTSDDSINLEIAITAKSLAPSLPVVVRIHDAKFAQQIQQVFEFDCVMSPTELTAPAFAAAAIGGRIFGDYTARNGLWLAIATLITPNHPLHNRSLREAASSEAFTPLYAEKNHQKFHGKALLDMVLTCDTVLHLMMPAQRWEQLWHPHSIQALV